MATKRDLIGRCEPPQAEHLTRAEGLAILLHTKLIRPHPLSRLHLGDVASLGYVHLTGNELLLSVLYVLLQEADRRRVATEWRACEGVNCPEGKFGHDVGVGVDRTPPRLRIDYELMYYVRKQTDKKLVFLVTQL